MVTEISCTVNTSNKLSQATAANYMYPRVIIFKILMNNNHILFCFNFGERERERERIPKWGLIPRPWDHDLNLNQESGAQPTKPPRCLRTIIIYFKAVWILRDHIIQLPCFLDNEIEALCMVNDMSIVPLLMEEPPTRSMLFSLHFPL